MFIFSCACVVQIHVQVHVTVTDPAGGKQKGECVWGRGEVQRPSIPWCRFPNQVASSSKCRGLRVYRPEGRRQSFQRGLFEGMKNSGSTGKSQLAGYLEATFPKNKRLCSKYCVRSISQNHLFDIVEFSNDAAHV